MIRKLLVLLTLCISLIPVAAQSSEEVSLEPIFIEYQGLMPEGIEYDVSNDRFILGSGAITSGSIFSVEFDGSISLLVEDEDLSMTLGVHIDQLNNRLLAVNFDPALMMGQTADLSSMGLAAYDMETWERIYFTSFASFVKEGSGLLPNDVTVDSDGNAYVTDSASPTIYKIDADGNASIFIRDNRLQSPIFNEQAPAIAMNGIDYHPDGYLLVAVLPGDLYRIPITNPENLTKIEIGISVSIDGMVLVDEQTVVAAALLGDVMTSPDDAEFHVVQLFSDDDWETATIENQVPVDEAVTTLAVKDNVIYGIQPQFTNPMNEIYTIRPIPILSDQ